MHHAQQGVIPERRVAFEHYLRDLEVLPADLSLQDTRASDHENDTMKDPVVHPTIKKKPSHETLGSILALSVIKEGNLTGVHL